MNKDHCLFCGSSDIEPSSGSLERMQRGEQILTCRRCHAMYSAKNMQQLQNKENAVSLKRESTDTDLSEFYAETAPRKPKLSETQVTVKGKVFFSFIGAVLLAAFIYLCFTDDSFYRIMQRISDFLSMFSRH